MMRLLTSSAGAALLMLTGCSTLPRKSPPPVAPPVAPVAVSAPAPAARPPETATAVETPPVTPGPAADPAPAAPVLPEGEYAILVETEPAGAMIVVNGIPVGRAPRRVLVSGTPQGFARSPVTVRARFLASDSTQQSASVEVELTALDRIPSALLFTPEKATRRW